MWPNPQFPVDLLTFTEQILNEKLYLLCSDAKLSVRDNKRRNLPKSIESLK